MTISSAPIKVQNDFEKTLREHLDEDKFASLKRYFDKIKYDIDNDKNILNYQNIDDRVNSSTYFYYPTESKPDNMNCFERAASTYFAAKEIYPTSNPELIFLTDKHKNVHASILFTHKNELWGADLSYNYFSKIMLGHQEITIPKQEEKEERKIKFKEINSIDDSFLDFFAKKLRSDSGIVDFLYESGQRTGYHNLGFLHNSSFMKVNSRKEIIMDIKLFGIDFNERNNCLRITQNPITNITNTELINYSSESWGFLGDEQQEKKIITDIYSENNYNIKNSSPFTQFRDGAYYLTNQREINIANSEIIKFGEHPNVKERFDYALNVSHKFGADVTFEFLKYLKLRYPNPNDIKVSNFDVNNLSSMNRFGEQMYENTMLQQVPIMIRMEKDAKRYIQKVSEQLL